MPRSTSQDCCCQSPLPWEKPLMTHACPGDHPTLAVRSGSVSCGITAPSSGSWYKQDFFCVCHPRVESLFLPVLLNSCNQIPLACKVRFPGDCQSLYWISKLGNLTWVSEPSQQGGNLFGISVLQFCGHPLREYGIWFYNYWTPPTIWLWLLLWIWCICFGSSSVFLLMIVQQLVAIFPFSQ